MYRPIRFLSFAVMIFLITLGCNHFTHSAVVNYVRKYSTGGPVLIVDEIPDVNGNGWADVVAGSADGNVYVLDGHNRVDDALMEKIWNKYVGSSVIWVDHMRDISGDTIDEVVIACENGLVEVLSGANGPVIWSNTTDVIPIYRAQVIPDVSGDGIPDILVGSDTGGSHEVRGLYCFDGLSGNLIWKQKFSTGSTYPNNVDFVGMPDVTGDDKYDVVWASGHFSGDISTWNGANGSMIKESHVYRLLERTLLRLTPDITGDGFCDLLLATHAYSSGYNMRPYAYLFSGINLNEVWNTQYAYDEYIWDLAFMEDIDSDGRSEVLVGIGDRLECRSGANGNSLWNMSLSASSSKHTHSSRVASSNSNLVVGCQDGVIYDVDPLNGLLVNYRSCKIDGEVNSLAFIDDVTGDGIHDLLVGGEDHNIYCFDYAAIPSDVSPPVISTWIQDPPESRIPEWQEVAVSWNITDAESGVNRQSVVLSYALNEGTTWQNVTMNKQGDTFTGIIPGYQNGTSIRYKILAYDNAGNMALDNKTFYIYMVIPELTPFVILPLFMITTLLAIIVCKRKYVVIVNKE